MSPSQILIAEDESIVALDIQDALKEGPYQVSGVAATGREAVDKARQQRPDLVLMDIHLKGDMDGVQAAREIHDRLDIPVIYLTAYCDERTLQRAKMTEPHGYLLKPFEREDLQASIEMALHKHRSDKAVKENRRWLETILRSTGDAIVATEPRGLVTFMNPVAERLTGKTSTWTSGPLWTDAIHLRDGEGNAPPPALAKAFEAGESVEFPPDTQLVPEGGGPARPVGGVLTPSRDDRGRLSGFVLAFRDITDHRRRETTLKEANEELQDKVRERTDSLLETNRELQRHIKEVDALYKYAPCGYHSLDKEGAVVRMNQTELNWLGRRPHEVLNGTRFADLLAPGSRERFRENLDVFRERGWLKDVEYEMLRKDGAPFPVLLNASGVKEDGVYVMDRVSVYNMTEKKQAERALMASESKFRCIAESAAEGILQSDEKGSLVYANQSAQALFGAGDLVGRKAETLVPERHRKKFKELLRSVRSSTAGAPAVAAALIGVDRGGREFPVEASISSWSEGGTRHFAAILRDVSERRKLEAALLHAGKLTAMGQMAAGLAHELKSPLGTIFSYADVLLSKEPGSSSAHILETIRRQAERCARLIDSLLDFARRHKTSETETSELRDVADSALGMVDSHAKTRGVSIVRQLSPEPLPVRGAKNMLEQVLVNLCMNAIDAMPGGGTLTVAAEQAEHRGRPGARVRVSDTGTGIAPDIRKTIFEPFMTTKEEGRGTGLGLWLAREIVVSLNGDINCESQVGKGSAFTVILPLSAPEPAPSEAAS